MSEIDKLHPDGSIKDRDIPEIVNALEYALKPRKLLDLPLAPKNLVRRVDVQWSDEDESYIPWRNFTPLIMNLTGDL